MENFGTAIVTATGTAFGIEITTAFSVTARVDAYDQEWLFSSADGIVDIQSIFGKGAVLVNAYGVDGTNYTVKDGKITDLTNDTNTALIKEVILETEDGQFKKVTFKVYTKLIDDAADLTIFNLTNKDITGAYLVTKDIVMSGTATMAHTAFVNASTGYTYKFKGSFDGGGHTVTANVARGGLFGALENATITNTNFVLNISGSTHGAGNNPTGLAYGVTGDQGTTTISNVYAELNPVSGLTAASNRTWALSLIVNASKALKMENAVIVNNDDFSTLKANTDKGWVGGALFYVDGARSDSAFCAANRKNVFVIAPKQLGNGYYVALSGGTTSQVFASNDAEGKADAAAKTNAAQYTYANVTRYATAKEFVDSKAWKNILPEFIMNAVNAKITAVS